MSILKGLRQELKDQLKELIESRNFNDPLGLNHYVIRNEGVHYELVWRKPIGKEQGPQFDIESVKPRKVLRATLLTKWTAEAIAPQIENGNGRLAEAVPFMQALNDEIKKLEESLELLYSVDGTTL